MPSLSIEYVFKDSLTYAPKKYPELASNLSLHLSKFDHPRQTKVRVPDESSSNWYGIEVEMEDCKYILSMPYPEYAWRIESDGSLRNSGAEFVSSPMQLPDAVNALSWLYSSYDVLTNGRRPNFTWRTSTHIHMSTRHMSEEEFMKFLLLYLIFEKSLFRYCNETRRDGNFAVPLLESEEFLIQFFHNLKRIDRAKPGNIDFKNLLTHWDKYSALGAFRLKDLGTLEFRHLEGTADMDKIVAWLCLINSLYLSSMSMKLEQIKEVILQLNTVSTYSEFKDTVFREYSQYLSCMKREDLIDSVCKIKEGMFFTQPSKIVSSRQSSGINKFLSKLVERKKKKDEEQKEYRRKELLDWYISSKTLKFSYKKGTRSQFEIDLSSYLSNYSSSNSF